jgi:NAD(P)-dependent dehydrogenase (short-subunit alcohol dehydrogenase family)
MPEGTINRQPNNSRRLEGKKALVTGAAHGLGATIAEMMALAGARVALSDLDGAAAQEKADAINKLCGAGTAIALVHDVRDPARWDEVVDATAAELGGLNVLVNNAGIVILGNIESLSLDDWNRTMSVNTDSVFHGCRSALRVMKENQPGSIVNISSIAGLYAGYNFAAYNASKAAVWLMSKSVALHCAHKKIDVRCNTIHPAFIRTRMLEDLSRGRETGENWARLASQLPVGRLGEPEDIGYAAIYLASDESHFMTGAELKLDGGMSAM